MTTLPTNFLFRFQFSCRERPGDRQDDVAPETLDSSYRVPLWSQFPEYSAWGARSTEPSPAIAANPENEAFFDFRVGWSRRGLTFTIVVAGKESQPTWTHSELKDADALRLCVDTRDLREIHRASRYCHKFAFYPFIGEAANVARPLAQWLPINRAREIPNRVDADAFVMASERRADGYAFSVFAPAACLTGYDPETFDRFGMHFAVVDSRHGAFTLQHGSPLPFEDDPSLWSSFVMTGAAPR